MRDLWRRAGTPGLRRRASGFAGLLRVIIAQQVSFHAAAAIWRRLEARCAPLTADILLTLDTEELRALGLSRQKAAFARSLAEALRDGRLRPRTWARLDDEAAIAELTEVKGIGRWTAECHLLFGLGRPDVWPADDLALAASCHRLLELAERPSAAETTEIAGRWQPWRSAAARLLWHGYGKAVL